jgi:hypothetical protein
LTKIWFLSSHIYLYTCYHNIEIMIT